MTKECFNSCIKLRNAAREQSSKMTDKNNNKKLATAISAIALATAATLTSGLATAGNLQEVEKQVFKGPQADFANWRVQQREILLEEQTDQFIIEYLEGVNTKKEERKLAKRLKKYLKKNKNVKFKRKLKNKKHLFKLAEKIGKKDRKAFLAAIKADKNVKVAEMDPMRFLMSENVPWGIPNIQADQLSDAPAGNMTVCIIDSGYQSNHPDLASNNHSGTNDAGTGNWYQAGGSHGTHVAGTIAGVNNSEGVVGVLPNTNVNIHVVKVFNESGWGYSSDLVTAVETCANNGADVVNMSLGGPSQNTSERLGLEAVANQGVLLIAASGNDGNSSLSYPASYDTVMAVGAVDESGKHAEFSQYTPQVEIAGPGEAVLSSVAGDGRLGAITVGSTVYDNGVAPQDRYISQGGSYTVVNVNGSASGVLSSCSWNGSSYSCSNVNGNICLAPRNANQGGSSYPEINPAKACADAGASGVIVYSDTVRPGLQNPYLVDATGAVDVPTVSVNRALGQTLLGKLGQSATISVTANQDYAYYNGTSMATPHVAGAAALAWANNRDCTADQVRAALKSTAIDLETSGYDTKTGAGLVQVKAASDYLGSTCGGTTPPPPPPPTGAGELTNGQTESGIAGAKDAEVEFFIDVPAGATNLAFNMSGGSGDADLYVRFGSKPTLSTYDCRPWKGGNTESCSFTSPSTGTYHVKVIGYSAFSGVSLTATYDAPAQGVTPYSTTVSNISASRSQWKYYTVTVPAGAKSFDVSTRNGTGDADLYLRFGAQPTTSAYDCRPYKNGNTETCTMTDPAAGTWHIGIRAYSAFSGVNMDVSYD
jgi:serine protease